MPAIFISFVVSMEKSLPVKLSLPSEIFMQSMIRMWDGQFGPFLYDGW
jgi:hypothetical protein